MLETPLTQAYSSVRLGKRPHVMEVVPLRRLAMLTAAVALIVGAVSPANAKPPVDALRVWVPTGDFASSSFERVAQVAPNPLPEDTDRSLSLTAVRGGHTSAQLAVASTVDLEELRVHVGPLIAPGAGIGAIEDAVQMRYPAYVPDERVGRAPVADPLLELDHIDVTAGETQPVWFTIAIPPRRILVPTKAGSSYVRMESSL